MCIRDRGNTELVLPASDGFYNAALVETFRLLLSLLHIYQMIHTGHFSVGPGRLDDLAVDVVTLTIGLH